MAMSGQATVLKYAHANETYLMAMGPDTAIG